MRDEELDALVAVARRQITGMARKHIDARAVERAAFTAVGRDELAARLWTDAREEADAARRRGRRAMSKRFGARNPNGWLSWVAIVGSLSAAVAATLTSGIRFDPAETVYATMLLAVVAGMVSLLVLILAAGRPMNRSMIRIHGVITVSLIIAGALMVNRGMGVPASVVGVCAFVSLVGYIVIFIARACDRVGADRVDTAINVMVSETLPEVQALSRRMQVDAVNELGPCDAERIVRIRTIVLSGLAAEGVQLDPVDPTAPAGSVIIENLIGTWMPEALRTQL